MTTDKHDVVFYGLSTCIHCRKAKDFLEEKNVRFELNYVDLADGEERSKLLARVREFNPDISFPTIVVDGSICIVGFKPDALTEALGR